ncbi:alkaline phosphatase D family protein [Nannocystaceae bacterium ST9]
MSITRRELLRRAGTLAVTSLIPCFTACTDDEPGDDLPSYEWKGELGPDTLFSHGVASGDPLADSVILWTRISSPDANDFEVFFEVALDPEFSERVAAGYVGMTDPAHDHTIKVDVEGLEPATTYYYRFWARGVSSRIARTRTAPEGASDRLRFAVCSCASLAHGYFHGYRSIAGRADLDAVLHLGDYIYEYASGDYGSVREYDPQTECLSLDDYRRRHAQYKLDPDLQEAHRQHPFITVWDDHEVANDGWTGGAENHDESEGDWATRKAGGMQAYFEWLPIREGEPGRVYRELPYGELVDLIVLDTRYTGRDQQIPLSDPDLLDKLNDPNRQLLGAEQEAWLFERLSGSTSQWKLLAQQILLGQIIITPGMDGQPNSPFITDTWDGYEAARQRLYAYITDHALTDVVVLTGDIHTSWANELTPNPSDPAVYDPDTGAGVVSVEFVTPGITSPGIAVDDATKEFLLGINPHVKWVDIVKRGYMTIDVDADRIQCDWWHLTVEQVESPNPSTPVHGAAWLVETGVARLVEGSGPAPDKPAPPLLAP